MALGLLLSIAGLIALGFGADQFVTGAARVATIFRVAPIVVGVIIVGFGTSAPEMVVSGLAASQGDLGIGVGNVVGSNVANVSLVLAAATLITRVPVDSKVLRREAPLSVASCLVFAVLIQGELFRWEGLLFAALLFGALWWILRSARADDALVGDVEEFVGGDVELDQRREVARTVIGLVVVVLASWVLVEGATRVADSLDLTGGFVGFTLVALGTSAPELVTAVVAARQGETDLLVGNLLGSNMFNSLAVGGVIAVVGPGPIPDATLTEVGSILMMTIVVVSWLMMITKRGVERWEGIVLIAMWIVAVVILSSGDEAAGAVRSVVP